MLFVVLCVVLRLGLCSGGIVLCVFINGGIGGWICCEVVSSL